MTLLRNVWQDMIDKRLWPIALALLIVTVAVPVVLSRGSSDEPAPTAAAAPGAGGLRDAVIVAADPGEQPQVGSERDPFFDPPQEASSAPSGGGSSSGGSSDTSGGSSAGGSTGKAVESAGTTSGSGGGSDTGSGSGSTGDSGSSDTGKDSGDSGSTTKAPKGSGEAGYDVNVTLTVGETSTKFPNTPRLTPMPSADNPLFVYLGVLSDKKTAVFMVAAASTAVGDGTCRPSADLCETLEMKAGETEFLDVTTGDNQTVQYQLDLTKITKIGTGGSTISKGSTDAGESASAAAAGKRAVRRARKGGAADTLDRYRFEHESGVIRRLTTKQVTRVRARHRARARTASAGTLHLRRTGTVVAGGL